MVRTSASQLRDAWTDTISAISDFVHSFYIVLVHSDEYLAVGSGGYLCMNGIGTWK